MQNFYCNWPIFLGISLQDLKYEILKYIGSLKIILQMYIEMDNIETCF